MPIQTSNSPRIAVWLGATACLVLASPALAQQAAPAVQYLSWVGKPNAGAVQAPPQLQPVADSRYPSIGSLGGRPSRYSPSVASGGLTPASAWYGPQASGPALPPPAYAQPQPQAQPQAQPQPQAYQGPAPAFVQPFAAPPAFAPQAYPQASHPQPAYPPQSVVVPQTALSAAPVYVQPGYAAQPMPGPHYQPQQRQLQQAQEQPGPAWAQPGYTPQVYTPAAPQALQAPAPQAPQPMPAPQQAPAPATVTGPGWASPQPVLAGSPVADPMAPRRDAPIFSIAGAEPQPQTQPTTAAPTQQGQPQGQPQAQQTASAEGPPRSGPRYYSVHRAAGHQPDPTAMPESVYAVIPEGAFLDAARTDLAEPPPPPVQTRTINGRVQAINQGDNPSLP